MQKVKLIIRTYIRDTLSRRFKSRGLFTHHPGNRASAHASRRIYRRALGGYVMDCNKIQAMASARRQS